MGHVWPLLLSWRRSPPFAAVFSNQFTAHADFIEMTAGIVSVARRFTHRE